MRRGTGVSHAVGVVMSSAHTSKYIMMASIFFFGSTSNLFQDLILFYTIIRGSI